MKKTFTSLTILMVCLLGYSQPDTEIFPDFTYTDLAGQTHNLQAYLDEGKTVVIDVFATWCPNCQQSVPGWETLYNQHGQGGDESMVLLSFERDPNTSNEGEYIEMYDIHSPVITEAEDVIDELWNITYQPRYFVICPDGTFESELNAPIYSNPQPLIDLADNCAEVVGIEEIENLDFNIHASNDLLTYTGTNANLDYEIFNSLGSRIAYGTLKENKGQLFIDYLRSGIYLMRVSNENAKTTLRFVKK